MKIKYKPLDIVVFNKQTKNYLIHMGKKKLVDKQYIYLGEISQMPEHGLFIDINTMKISMNHMYDYRKAKLSETGVTITI